MALSADQNSRANHVAVRSLQAVMPRMCWTYPGTPGPDFVLPVVSKSSASSVCWDCRLSLKEAARLLKPYVTQPLKVYTFEGAYIDDHGPPFLPVFSVVSQSLSCQALAVVLG